jgi:hypothetical protein
MARAAVLAFVIVQLAGCSFHPTVGEGRISCAGNQDCPGGLTCQPGFDRSRQRLCCGPGGCPRPPADAGPPALDALTPEQPDAALAPPDATVAADAAARADAVAEVVAGLVKCRPTVRATGTGRTTCAFGLLEDAAAAVDLADGYLYRKRLPPR